MTAVSAVDGRVGDSEFIVKNYLLFLHTFLACRANLQTSFETDWFQVGFTSRTPDLDLASNHTKEIPNNGTGNSEVV